jgi:hypothetical protein
MQGCVARMRVQQRVHALPAAAAPGAALLRRQERQRCGAPHSLRAAAQPRCAAPSDAAAPSSARPAQPQPSTTRRTLLTLPAAVAAPLLLLPTPAARAALFGGGGGRAERLAAFTALLTSKLAAAPLDYRSCVRLLFNDAASGAGHDGSVHFADELSRPENADLAATVAALAEVRRRVLFRARTRARVGRFARRERDPLGAFTLTWRAAPWRCRSRRRWTRRATQTGR